MLLRGVLFLLLFVPGVGVSQGTVSSQLRLMTVEGVSIRDRLGSAVVNATDLNADGFDELLIGAPFDDTQGLFNNGRLLVVSSRNGGVLLEISGTSSQENLGLRVALAGKQNGDAVADLAALSANSLRLYSGFDGVLLRTIPAPSGYRLNLDVVSVGDEDADGFDDLLVAGTSSSSSLQTAVFLLSGATGAALRTHSNPASNTNYGYAIAAVGDLDADGKSEYAVGASRESGTAGSEAGVVRVYSGASGVVLYTFQGDFALANMGTSLAGGGDFNGDFVPDLVAGAPYAQLMASGPQIGVVRVFSGATGGILHTIAGPGPDSAFGDKLGIGDMDGDSVPDIAVRAGYTTVSNGVAHVLVVSGLTPSVVLRDLVGAMPRPLLDTFGASLATLHLRPEVPADLVIGDSRGGSLASELGRIFIEAVTGPKAELGEGCGPSGARISSTPPAAGQPLAVSGRGPANVVGVVFVGRVPGRPLDLGGGCGWFLDTPYLFLGAIPATGTGLWQLPPFPLTLPPGSRVALQAVYANGELSNGLYLQSY